MPITWMIPSRVRGEGSTATPMKLIFTIKPKGVRLNSAITRIFRDLDLRLFYFGYDEETRTFYIKPTKEAEGAIRLSYPKSGSGQASSVMIWNWAIELGIEKTAFTGTWHKKQKYFTFQLEPAVSPEEEKPRRGRKPKASAI